MDNLGATPRRVTHRKDNMYNIQAPHQYGHLPIPRIFLAGSIEMGTAEHWQVIVENRFQSYEGTILNPRRDDWDGLWKQSIHDVKFNEQVTWELDGLDYSNIVLVHFDVKTYAPITLLELGYLTRFNKPVIVSCGKEFYRRGNVEIVCDRRSNFDLCENLDDAMAELTEYL